MSGIAGLISFSGAPVQPRAIGAMLDAQAYRGPDGRGVWADGVVGLGHNLLRTVPEAEQETQPFSLDQTVWITADGRLDNRDDLIRALRHTTPKPLDGVPDCHLMLLAYHHWGEDFSTYLIGDFALAIWDGRSRRLLCACDALAIRSLYYAVNGKQFIFASSIGAVLAVLNEKPAPNEVFIAQFLTQTVLDGRTATFYEGILRLAPAHMLNVEEDTFRKRKYYEFGTRELLHYASDQDYVDHFRDLLEQALLSRLRSSAGTAISVSGGLDSSSLACLTNHFFAQGRINSPRPATAFCMVTNHQEMDERPYQNLVVKRLNQLNADFFNLDSDWSFKSFGIDGGHPFQQPEIHPMRSCMLGSYTRLRETGHRAYITGDGSDVVNGRISGYSAGGTFRDLSWREQVAEWPHFHHEYSTRSIIRSSYLRPILSPFIPQSLQRARFIRSVRRETPFLDTRWIAKVFCASASDQASYKPDLPTRAARLAYDTVNSGGDCLWYATTDATSSFANIELRYPYLDRRLIEFVLHVPTRMLIRRGWDKWILREAIGELLPKRSRFRLDSPDASALVNEGLRKKEKSRIMELLSGSQLVKRGWVHGDAWVHAWRDYWAGTTDQYAALTAGIGVEAWLRLYAN